MSELLHACELADRGQVALHRGEACFHIEDGKFCFRARHWAGHALPNTFHGFRSLADVISGIEDENARLRVALENAPHHRDCGEGDRCDCWHRAARGVPENPAQATTCDAGKDGQR